MARVQMTQAVAADYADAMLVARRAKNVLAYSLALVLLVQLAVFFVARYVPGLNLRGGEEPTAAISATVSTPFSPPAAPAPPAPAPATRPGSFDVVPGSTSETPTSAAPTTVAATAPAVARSAPPAPASMASAHHPSPESPAGSQMPQWPLEYLVAVTSFLGVVLSIVLAVNLLLIIMMALVGKPKNLTGISHVTGAFNWSIVLFVLLFPWQSLLNSNVRGGVVTPQPASMRQGSGTMGSETPDLKIPGVLYTFPELVRDYDFPGTPMRYAILKWSRYVAFPILALIILLMVQVRSSQGWRSAVGDTEVIVDGPRP